MVHAWEFINIIILGIHVHKLLNWPRPSMRFNRVVYIVGGASLVALARAKSTTSIEASASAMWLTSISRSARCGSTKYTTSGMC